MAFVYPALFYVGLMDAYLAHHLYSSSTRSASVCDAAGVCRDPFARAWDELNVPFPPEPRVFRRYFQQSCEQGDVLVIEPMQTRLDDSEASTVRCAT